MQQFVKFVCHFLIRNCTTLLWFVSGFVRERQDTDCGNFLSNVECATLDCGALQDDTLRYGHQSVALLVGEKCHTCRHVFNCRCSVIITFFLTRTRYTNVHAPPPKHFGKLSFYPVTTFSTYRPAIT